MTQKELAYVEDAIGHECTIINILEESVQNASSEEITSFFEEEINTHTTMKEKLMNLLEEKSNE